MKTKTLLSALTLALAGYLIFTWMGKTEKAKAAPSGSEVYAKKCLSCHGKQGEGVAKIAAMLKTKIADFRGRTVTADTLAAWKKIAVEGKGKMPGQAKSKLSGEEIDSALAYIVTLAKAPAPAAKPKTESTATEGKK